MYLEGRTVRHADLSRDAQGPRAVLNAVSRLAESYNRDCDRVRQDLALARTQLRDYEARLGRPFPQAEYLAALTDLRDRLKTALAAPQTAEPSDAPTPAALAAQIQALQSAHAARPEPPPPADLPRRPRDEPPRESPNPAAGDGPEIPHPDPEGRPEDADGASPAAGPSFAERVTARRQRNVQRPLF